MVSINTMSKDELYKWVADLLADMLGGAKEEPEDRVGKREATLTKSGSFVLRHSPSMR